jgi:hypothetical protein
MRRAKTTEMPFLRAVVGYGMTDQSVVRFVPEELRIIYTKGFQ